MTSDDHLSGLGKLLANLHSLELLLRIYLINRPGANPAYKYGEDILELPKGSKLPKSDLTAHTFFSNLVEDFNDIAKSEKTQAIDEKVIEIRNILVHGCVFGREPEFPLHIVKFSKPEDGMVTITTNTAMTLEWFDQQHKIIRSAIEIVLTKSELSDNSQNSNS